ncbi:MAG: Lactose transport system permease protein LacF [Anaerolineae bacterium]|nr:Lactose transport system permease protein LacF [Anaerolineae bacterium]RIK25799.1 MAG: sugar ABC transporter permease [Chloroflexota bacterium]
MNSFKELLTIPRLKPIARREALQGLAFISIWFIGFFIFTLIPMLATLAFSFSNINLAQEEALRFVGFGNYQKMLSDSSLRNALGVTLKYALIALPVGLAVPFAVAVLLNNKHLRAKGFFRVMFYLPYVIPFVAGIFAWGGLLNPEQGWINQTLEALGVQNPPGWLNDPLWVYPSLVILGLWGIGSAVIIYLASLQGVPTELYDAAKVDGAGWWATMRNVTLPMMSPVIFYSLVLGIVGVFQYFLVPLVVTDGTGRPGGATMFFNLYMYKTFFTFQNMSYGAAQAWVLFILILVVTIFLFWSSKYWVYYAGETREG